MSRILAVAIAAVALSAASPFPVVAQDTACGKFASACYTTGGITSDQAMTIVREARDFAKAKNMAVAVAVVDPTGKLLAFGRSDGATHGASDGAIAKAVTAVSHGADTDKLQVFFETGGNKALPYGSALLQMLPIEGGMLVLGTDKRIMGAIGVGGAGVFDGATDEEKKAPNTGIARRAKIAVIP